ncbi:MAG: ORF6N domain-containing protein [Candidatus Omnitrophota bacterium]
MIYGTKHQNCRYPRPYRREYLRENQVFPSLFKVSRVRGSQFIALALLRYSHIYIDFIESFRYLSCMKKKTDLTKSEQILSAIFLIRGQRVILDTDLAAIYGISTFRLNEAVKRNRERFPDDFMYQLTKQEVRNLISQIAISSLPQGKNLRSQIATSSWGGRRSLPYVFTEHGAIMAANLLNSDRAVQMSVFVVRAFVRMRALLTDNRKLSEELKKLERKLTKRLDVHELAIVDVLRRVMRLLDPPEVPAPEKPPIGFQT